MAGNEEFWGEMGGARGPPSTFFFFFTLVTGPGRSLSLNLSAELCRFSTAHARVKDGVDRFQRVLWNAFNFGEVAYRGRKGESGCAAVTTACQLLKLRIALGTLEVPQRWSFRNISFRWNNHLQHSGVAQGYLSHKKTPPRRTLQ